MKINGYIKDHLDKPIPGSFVFVSDVNGVMSNFPRKADADINGDYSIEVNEGEYLTADFAGQKLITAMPTAETVDFVLLPAVVDTVVFKKVVVKKPFPWAAVIVAIIIISILININKK